MNTESGWHPTRKLAVDLPSNTEIEREKDLVRKNILAAIQRILLGCPKHVPAGAISVSDLAKEASVGRHYLYQNHPDLRNRYEYLRDRADQPTGKEAELERALVRTKSELTSLRALQAKTSQEAKDWKAFSDLLARAINVLQEQIHQQQIQAERVARQLKALQDQTGALSPIVSMHSRPSRRPGAS